MTHESYKKLTVVHPGLTVSYYFYKTEKGIRVSQDTSMFEEHPFSGKIWASDSIKWVPIEKAIDSIFFLRVNRLWDKIKEAASIPYPEDHRFFGEREYFSELVSWEKAGYLFPQNNVWRYISHQIEGDKAEKERASSYRNRLIPILKEFVSENNGKQIAPNCFLNVGGSITEDNIPFVKLDCSITTNGCKVFSETITCSFGNYDREYSLPTLENKIQAYTTKYFDSLKRDEENQQKYNSLIADGVVCIIIDKREQKIIQCIKKTGTLVKVPSEAIRRLTGKDDKYKANAEKVFGKIMLIGDNKMSLPRYFDAFWLLDADDLTIKKF